MGGKSLFGAGIVPFQTSFFPLHEEGVRREKIDGKHEKETKEGFHVLWLSLLFLL